MDDLDQLEQTCKLFGNYYHLPVQPFVGGPMFHPDVVQEALRGGINVVQLSVIVRIDSKPGKIVVGEYELSQFSYFQRGSIQEFMNFFSRTLAEKTPNPGDRQSVENQEYIGHIHTRRQDLSAVLIADKEYPRRVAFAVLNEALDQFLRQCPDAQQWTGASASVQSFLNNTLKQLMAKYQNPAQADSLLRVQKELDETKIVMHKTIESVLERGDRLEDLVAKSDELSTASKTFYKTAKKTNSCCHLM